MFLSPVKSSLKKISFLIIVLTLIPNVVFAHPGHFGVINFIGGFTHPLTGVDHILAMGAVGLWAAQMGGRARWQLPLSFVALMLVGGALNYLNIPILAMEQVIGASSLILGLLIVKNVRIPLWVGTTLVGFFAIFHGYAHMAEVGSYSAAGYIMGFVTATTLLHLTGLAIGILGSRFDKRSIQFAGVALTSMSVLFIFGVI